LAAQKGL